MSSDVVFQIQSTLILLLLFIGVALRKKRRPHVITMLVAIVWDFLLILQIELSRGAVAKAAKAVENPILLNIHVTFAICCVLLYMVVIYLGRKLLKGDNSIRPWHKRVGILILIIRTLTYITSFLAVTH